MKSYRSQVLARALLVLLLASVALIALFGAIVWASQNSLPGGTLYGVKRLTEDTQRFFVSSKQQRAGLELKFAARRLSFVNSGKSSRC